MSDLTDKIMDVLMNMPEDVENMDIIRAADDIAALFEAERKPDTITVPEAVERLVAVFEKWYINATESKDEGWWDVLLSANMDGVTPSWAAAMINGENSDAAVKFGLEDLFITILEGDEK